MSAESILETRGLTKEFKGFVAVNNVDLKVQRGHIHALIGPNGAGKTTFFNLLTKFLTPTRGVIIFNGADITHERGALEAMGQALLGEIAAFAFARRRDAVARAIARAITKLDRRARALGGDLARIGDADQMAHRAQWLLAAAVRAPRAGPVRSR